jgi:hypothetical protein
VDYIQLTAWHGDLITLYPSEVQEAYGLTSGGEPRYTERDVIGDLLDELDAVNKKYGTNIELYLYTHPGQGTALHAIDQEPVVVEARSKATQLHAPVALAVIDHIDGFCGKAVATLHLYLLCGL